MIHRPPNTDFDAPHLIGVCEPGPQDSLLLKILAVLCIGLAISGLLSAFRGWSTHSDVNT